MAHRPGASRAEEAVNSLAECLGSKGSGMTVVTCFSAQAVFSESSQWPVTKITGNCRVRGTVEIASFGDRPALVTIARRYMTVSIRIFASWGDDTTVTR